MSIETLADKAVSTVSAITTLEELLDKRSDYGEATGFSDELDTLRTDASNQLSSLRVRACALKRRIERTDKEQA